MKHWFIFSLSAASLALGILPAASQSAASLLEQMPVTETGQVVFEGHPTPYRIRHLPVNSFPDLPPAIQDILTHRQCLIPQTYEAHQPENVIHGSFQRPGSSDWAVLCSVHGTATLLVFFGSDPAEPAVLGSAPETERLQPHGSDGVLGFNWGIDAASPEAVHEAQAAMRNRPPRLEHDAVADSIVDRSTVYHYYSANAWTVVDTQD